MTKAERDAMIEVVRAAMKEDRDEFWIPQPEHYLDHQHLKACREDHERRMKNHNFVDEVRTGTVMLRRAGWASFFLGGLACVYAAVKFWITAGMPPAK